MIIDSYVIHGETTSSPFDPAVTRYVRAAASGTGTGLDWTNAYTALPATLTRGFTYYVAGGAYAAYTFDDATVGSQVISIVKATVAAHGTATGWNDSYGTTQAVWTAPLQFQTHNWVLNGVSRSGWRTGYGFKVNNNNGSNQQINQAGISVGTNGANTPADNVRITYCEVAGSHNTNGTSGDVGVTYISADAFQVIHVSPYVGYCWVHDVGGVALQFASASDPMMEYCWMQNNQSTTVDHGEGLIFKGTISGTCTFRYSYIENMVGTAYLSDPSGISGFVDGNIYIYGNVLFYNAGEANTYTGAGADLYASFLMDGHNYTSMTSLYIVQNTIVSVDRVDPGATTGRAWIYNSGGARTITTLVVENNLYYDITVRGPFSAQNPPGLGTTTCTTFLYDYNEYHNAINTDDTSAHKVSTTGNPFVDVTQAAGHVNFHLAANTTAGTPLSAPFNVDMDGVTRSTWSRGAFEYV